MTGLRELLAAATPTPWTWLPDDVPLGRRFGGEGALDESGYVRSDEDAELIVGLVNAADELLAVAEAARKHVAEWEAVNAPENCPLPIQRISAALAALDAKTGAA